MSIRLGMMIALDDVCRRLAEASNKDHDVDTVLAKLESYRRSLSRVGEGASCRRAADIVMEELQDALVAEEVSSAVISRMNAVVRRVFGVPITALKRTESND